MGHEDRSSDGDKVALLRAVAQARGGQTTQREVAATLGVTKVEARRRLRAAVAEGLVEAVVEESPAAPGRGVFSLTRDKGRAELERLEARAPRAR